MPNLCPPKWRFLGKIWGELLAGPNKKLPEICIKAVYGGIWGIAIDPRSIKNLEQPFRTVRLLLYIFYQKVSLNVENRSVLRIYFMEKSPSSSRTVIQFQQKMPISHPTHSQTVSESFP